MILLTHLMCENIIQQRRHNKIDIHDLIIIVTHWHFLSMNNWEKNLNKGIERENSWKIARIFTELNLLLRHHQLLWSGCWLKPQHGGESVRWERSVIHVRFWDEMPYYDEHSNCWWSVTNIIGGYFVRLVPKTNCQIAIQCGRRYQLLGRYRCLWIDRQ